VEEIHRQLLTSHPKTISDVVETGAAVATAIDQWPVTDGDSIKLPLERLLRHRGLGTPLLETLETGAEVIGEDISGAPVTAPPYFVVTSRGPLCRGTLADGCRLVIAFELFEVATRPRRYRFSDPRPEECLRITIAGCGEH